MPKSSKPKAKTAGIINPGGRRPKQVESAILHMTDVHYGKKTSSFNTKICKERIFRAAQKATTIKDSMGGTEFDELVIPLTGDIPDGSGIYPTQAHHQELTSVEDQCEEVSDVLAECLRDLSGSWKSIRVETVPGNHGRLSKFAHEADNFDIITYKYLRNKVANIANVKINSNPKKADPFIRKIMVRSHPMLLYHGHDVRSFANIPWYGFQLRLAKWSMTDLAPFKTVFCGHVHTVGSWAINNIQLYLSGALITDDNFALQCLGYSSNCAWWFLGVSNKYPTTWQYALDLVKD